MKKHIWDFLKRGLMAASGGPVVLAIIYGILGSTGTVSSLSPQQVCLGVLTVTLMAFIAAGITTVYSIERLPLAWAILLHGLALYCDYILIYLLNGWLQRSLVPILIFTGIFAAGYAIIWLAISLTIKAKTDRINQKLRQNTR